MVLELVLGASGAGKSYFCKEEMLREAKDNSNENYLMIVPEQFTLQTQLEMVSSSENKGIINIDVLSFNRLAHRVFEEIPGYHLQVIDDLGKMLILRKLLQSNKEQLRFIGKNVNRPGVVEEIKSIISELYQYNIGVDQLLDQGNKHKNRQLGIKLEDIAHIYESFQEYMKRDQIIVAEELLTLLANAIEGSKVIKNATICLDGFTGFTPVQYNLIAKLMEYAKKIVIPITIDEREVNKPIVDEHELFHMSKKTIENLKKLAKEQGAQEVREVIICNGQDYVNEDTDENVNKDVNGSTNKKVNRGIPCNGPTKRHENNKELLHIEKNLFRFPYQVYSEEVEDISIVSYRNPAHEVEEVAIKISNLVRKDGYRYKDIAVVSGGIEEYSHNVERIFHQYDIPFFIDNKKSMLENPLSELLRALLEIIDKDFSYDSVMHFLRTGLCNSYLKKEALAEADEEVTITVSEIDKLENYILALGIRGKSRWSKKWDKVPRASRKKTDLHVEDIDDTRRKVYELLKDVYEVVRNKDNPIKVKIEAIYDFLVMLDVEHKLEQLSDEFQEAGDMHLYREYKQIYRIVLDLLDKMYEVIGDETGTPKEILQIVETGLTEAKVGLVPPSLDQVVVGDVERTRLKDNKVLFFIGVNDGYIPKASSSKSLINDNEREILESDNFELAPNQKRKLFVEQFYLYLNLTKPADKLFLSLCRVDKDGKVMRASYLVGRILKLFSKLEVAYEDDIEFTVDKVMTPKNSLHFVITELNSGNVNHTNPLFQELYSWYRRKDGWSQKIDHLLDGHFYINEVNPLHKDVIKKLYGDSMLTSVSRLERFATCPFSFLMTYGLELKEREEYEVATPDIGNILHESIEQFAIRLKNHDLTWKDVNDQQRDEMIDAVVGEIAEVYANNVLTSSYRSQYMISRLQRIAKRTVWALQKHLKVSEFNPVGYEIKFDSLSNKLDTLNIQLDADRKLELSGKIDRLDAYETEQDMYLKIIDYKSGMTKLSLERVLNGLQLQLFVYMYAALELMKKNTKKNVKPAAALYYNIQDPIVDKESRGEEPVEITEKNILDQLRMSGLVTDDLSVIQKLDSSMTNKSTIIPVEFKKDGTPSSRASMASDSDFNQLGDFIHSKIEDMGNEILSGNIAITPYKLEQNTGCDYCAYRTICKFDKKLGNDFNRINKLKTKDEFWSKVRGENHVD